MMRLLIPSLLVGLGALLIGPSWAAACSCAPPPAPELALEGAGLVFEGTVVGVPAAPPENEPMGFGPVEYRFNVARSWKGNPGMEVRVSTNSSGAACGRRYSKGETYIVYASLGDDGTIRDSLCSRTRSLANATDDLAAFGDGVVPHSRGGARPGPGPVGEPTPSSDPGELGDGNTESAQSQVTSEGVAAGTTPPAETSQPADAVDSGDATASSEPVSAPKNAPAEEPPPEDDDKGGPRENCSVSSADASNSLMLILLTGCIVAFRRRVGV